MAPVQLFTSNSTCAKRKHGPPYFSSLSFSHDGNNVKTVTTLQMELYVRVSMSPYFSLLNISQPGKEPLNCKTHLFREILPSPMVLSKRKNMPSWFGLCSHHAGSITNNNHVDTAYRNCNLNRTRVYFASSFTSTSAGS
jgi:hypothetical protein